MSLGVKLGMVLPVVRLVLRRRHVGLCVKLLRRRRLRLQLRLSVRVRLGLGLGLGPRLRLDMKLRLSVRLEVGLGRHTVQRGVLLLWITTDNHCVCRRWCAHRAVEVPLRHALCRPEPRLHARTLARRCSMRLPLALSLALSLALPLPLSLPLSLPLCPNGLIQCQSVE